jgi:hypothetical protein
VEQQRDMRVGGQFTALAAVEIGVEQSRLMVERRAQIGAMPLEQDHAQRGQAIGRGGGERHGVGIVGLGQPGLGEPVLEDGVRVAVGDGILALVHGPSCFCVLRLWRRQDGANASVCAMTSIKAV